MILFKLVERSLGLISTLILARLLTPADFGVVAMALSFIFMAELLAAFGFDVAIIQNQNTAREYLDTAWTCNLLLGLTITLVMLVSAMPIASFYRRPELASVVMALAFGPLIAGCENIGTVAFRKELNFRREFIFQVSRKLVGFAIVIPIAFVARSYWALVTGILVSKIAGTVLSYLMHPFRPRFSVEKIAQLFSFSRWLLINNVVSFFKERSTDFFVGRASGAAALGTYNVAYELANLPSTEISAPINRALLPGFAKLSDVHDVSSSYSNAVGLLATFALPAAGCILLLAGLIVPVLLGRNWMDAVPLMQILAVSGAIQLFHSSMNAVLVGRGHPQRVTLANVAYAVTLLVLLAVVFGFASDNGVIGAAYATLATAILATPVYLWQMRRTLSIGPAVFLRSLARPLVATAVMLVVGAVLLPPQATSVVPIVAAAQLIASALLSVGVYAIALFALWRIAGSPPGPESMVITRVITAVNTISSFGKRRDR